MLCYWLYAMGECILLDVGVAMCSSQMTLGRTCLLRNWQKTIKPLICQNMRGTWRLQRGWRGGTMVGRRALGRKAVSSIPGRASRRSCVTTLGKLLTPTCLEGSPVSSLKCDRRQGQNLESCLAPVCAASGNWFSKPGGCVTALGPWP